MKNRFNFCFLVFAFFLLNYSFAFAEAVPNEVVKEFLVSASLEDSAKAMTYLSPRADKSIVKTFIKLFKNPGGPWQPADRSGWILTSPAEWEVDEKIDESNQGATVKIGILWKGGSPPTHISMGRIFYLIKENNIWKIIKFAIRESNGEQR